MTMFATDPEPHTAIDPARLREAASLAVGTLKLLANEDRLLLLCQLSQGERCVGELEAELGIRQPTLSQQLAVLRREGLVATEREGKYIRYALADARALALMQRIHQLFCEEGAA